MARMYPTPIRPDTESRAEHLLYKLFRDELPDDYHVFHSVAWQARARGQYHRDSEADFVVVHPKKGILVIEAKAGQIGYNGRRGIWTQNDHEMGKDPFEQAKSSRYHLKRTLEEESYWRDRYITFGHAVAFPNVAAPSTPLTLQAPSTIILDQHNLQDVEAWMEMVFAYYKGRHAHHDLDFIGLEYLINLLAPIRELRSLLSLDIEAEQSEFIRLTESQYHILDLLAVMPRAAIAGCAGSGKTVLAVEKARRLAKQGWRVLFTCFNRNLATYLSEDYLRKRPRSLDIMPFHKMATDLVKRSGQQQPVRYRGGSDKSNYFKETLPEQLATAADILGPQYDAIVVDEAQDFQENWWLPLQLLLEEPDEGTFYIFFDDNQNIYGGLRKVMNLAQSFHLTENFRNTQSINQMVTRFYKADHTITALGPAGRAIEIITYDTDRGMLNELRRCLHRLVNEEKIDAQDIVILTPRTPAKSSLSKAGRLGSFLLTRNWDIDYNEIYYETIYSFKGLESPVVILAELGTDLTHIVDELLYVGCSRARNHLIILCQNGMEDRFVSDGGRSD